MRLTRSFWLRIRTLWRARFDRDLQDEYDFHIEMSVRDNIAEGMNAEDARRRAVRDFGNRTALKERSRDMFTFQRAESWLQDIRYGARLLRRNPAFTLTVILTLALGIGANVAIFSAVYGILLRPLPYRDGGQLVVLHQRTLQGGSRDIPFSVSEISDYGDMSRTLDEVVEHHSMNFLLLRAGGAERVNTAVVSANFFDVLGVRPILGRTFLPSDYTENADAVLVLSHEYWQARHGGDPDIVGQVFEMNNRPHRVIGVLPPIPQYPVENDVYMPTSHCPTRSSPAFIANRQSRMMTAFGRIRPESAIEEVRADVATIAARLEQAYPEAYPQGMGYSTTATPLRDDLTRRARTTLLVLLGAAGFVLLIACANVANLLLAELLRLNRELSVRMAVGASRGRLVRQLLTESLMLSLAGAVLGFALAPAALGILVEFASLFTPRAAEIRLDGPVTLFALLLAVGTGLLFGLAPALMSGRAIADVLKRDGGRAISVRVGGGLRSGLVVAQVAVSFVLLIGAGLMIRSFVALQSVETGFDTDRLLTMRLSPNFYRYPIVDGSMVMDGFDALLDDILRAVDAVPGVESSAYAGKFPFNTRSVTNGPDSLEIEIEGIVWDELRPRVDLDRVGAGYFETIGQAVVEGRDFTEADSAGSRRVAVVNESMAREYWGAASPLGRRIGRGGGDWWEIVGVVADVREYGLGRPVASRAYVPTAQSGFAENLVVRTSTDPMAVFPSIRAALYDMDPELAVDRVATIESLRRESVASPRVMTLLLGIFAGLALLISASGIAGVMALSVSQRTKELGLRMALGAPRRSVLYAVVRKGFALALVGTGLGLAGAFLLSRMLSSLLYETAPTDAMTFLAVSLVFLAVAALACAIPARRVTAIDPMVAIRQE